MDHWYLTNSKLRDKATKFIDKKKIGEEIVKVHFSFKKKTNMVSDYYIKYIFI